MEISHQQQWVLSDRMVKGGSVVVDIFKDNDEKRYTTDPHQNRDKAIKEAEEWLYWCNNVSKGIVESIYYIIAVPDTWAGPPPGAHALSGLQMKIGRSKNIDKRLSNLQTGAEGQLIIHAMEPGSSSREKELHAQFSQDRRQGEWFACSPQLQKHTMETWGRHLILPPEHQQKMLELCQRITEYRAVREVLGGPPDMVNPSINEPWYGKVFLDLVHSNIAKGKRIDS